MKNIYDQSGMQNAFLREKNNAETASLIKNNNWYFDNTGKLNSKNKNDYSENGMLVNSQKQYDAYKKRDDTIQGIQASLYNLGVTDYDNKPLKIDGVFGAKTLSAYDKFLKVDSAPKINYLSSAIIDDAPHKPAVPSPITSAALAGYQMSVTDPLQTPLTKIGYRTDTRRDGSIKHQLYDTQSNLRLFELDKAPYKNSTSKPHINIAVPKSAPEYQKAIAKAANHKPLKPKQYEMLHDFGKVGDVVKIGGKVLGVIGTAGDVINFGVAINDDLNDHNGVPDKTLDSALKSGSQWVGSALGAKGGAAVGATLGTFIMPGIGTAVGGALGGLGGGYFGADLAIKPVDKDKIMELIRQYGEKHFD